MSINALKKSQVSKIAALSFIGGIYGGTLIGAAILSVVNVTENQALVGGIVLGAILSAVIATIYESAQQG